MSFLSAVASISVHYIQNSLVEATGDIIIKGKGVYNSSLEAGGNVLITGVPGVSRGGRLLKLNKEMRKIARLDQNGQIVF